MHFDSLPIHRDAFHMNKYFTVKLTHEHMFAIEMINSSVDNRDKMNILSGRFISDAWLHHRRFILEWNLVSKYFRPAFSIDNVSEL